MVDPTLVPDNGPTDQGHLDDGPLIEMSSAIHPNAGEAHMDMVGKLADPLKIHQNLSKCLKITKMDLDLDA